MVVATKSSDRPAAAKPKSKPKLSRAETSRLNGSRSRGPVTQTGRDKSRFNAVTHGMTAKSDVLPGENAGRFEANRLDLHLSMNPRNPLEATMLDRIARNAWRAERTEVSADFRVQYNVNHDALDRNHVHRQEVTALGQLLVADLFATSHIRAAARAGGAEHPAQLVALLETTIPGCDWLLGRLRTLEHFLPRPGIWVEIHGFELARLMGFHVSDFATDYQVAYVLLASEVVTADTKAITKARIQAALQARAEAKARARAEAIARGEPDPNVKARKQARDEKVEDYSDELDQEEERKIRMGRGGPKWALVENLIHLHHEAPRAIQHMQLDRLVPDDAVEARQRLAEVIGQMIERLESVRAVLVRVAEADAATAAARLEVDLGHEGELQHRYIVAHDRALIRSINAFYTIRKADNGGTVESIVPDQGDALIPGPTDLPSPADLLPAAGAAASEHSGVAPSHSAAPHPGVSPSNPPAVSLSNPPQNSAVVPPIIEERLTQTLFGEAFEDTPHILRNEPEKPCRVAEPEPAPPEISAAPLAATVPAGPPTRPPAPVVTAVPAAPSSHSVQQPNDDGSASSPQDGPRTKQGLRETLDDGSASSPQDGPGTEQSAQLTTDNSQLTTRKHPPTPPFSWELIPETCRGDYSRYKHYQDMLQATYGVRSPEEFRKKYRKDPPLG
jgi:hypothetical protein